MIVAAGMSRSSLLVAWMRCATSFSPSNACGQPDAAGGSPQSRPNPAAGDAPLGVSALIEALHAGRARSAPRGDWYERDLALLGRVRESYLRQAATPGWLRLDASGDRGAIADDVFAAVSSLPG